MAMFNLTVNNINLFRRIGIMFNILIRILATVVFVVASGFTSDDTTRITWIDDFEDGDWRNLYNLY